MPPHVVLKWRTAQFTTSVRTRSNSDCYFCGSRSKHLDFVLDDCIEVFCSCYSSDFHGFWEAWKDSEEVMRGIITVAPFPVSTGSTAVVVLVQCGVEGAEVTRGGVG